MGLEYYTTNTDPSPLNTPALPSTVSPSVQMPEKPPQAFHLWSQLLPSLSNTDPVSPSDERNEAIEDRSEPASALSPSNRSPKPPKASSSRRVTGRAEVHKVGTRPANSSWAQVLPSLKSLRVEEEDNAEKVSTSSTRTSQPSIQKPSSLSTSTSPSPKSQTSTTKSTMASSTSAPKQTYSSFAQMLPSLNGTYDSSSESDPEPQPLPQLTKASLTPQPHRIVASSAPAVHSFSQLLPSLNGSYHDEETEQAEESAAEVSHDYSWEDAYGWDALVPVFEAPKQEYKVPALTIETVQKNEPYYVSALEGLEKHVVDAVKERKDSAISMSFDLMQG